MKITCGLCGTEYIPVGQWAPAHDEAMCRDALRATVKKLTAEIAEARTDWEVDGDWEGKTLTNCGDVIWDHGYMTAAKGLWSIVKTHYVEPKDDPHGHGYYESRHEAQDKFLVHYKQLEEKAVENDRLREALTKIATREHMAGAFMWARDIAEQAIKN